MNNYIAQRTVLFSRKGGGAKMRLSIRISAPSAVDPTSVEFPVDEDMAVCHVDFDNLPEHNFDVYGMDSLQAVNMASDLEPVLRRLSGEYDFFWSTGEPYFED